MPSSTVIVALAGLIATVLSGYVTAKLANRRHAEQLRHNRDIADRAALQDVLDRAAVMLRGLVWANDDLLDRFRTADTAAEIDAAGARARELVRESLDVGSRLALRIGREHPLAHSYDAALDEFLALLTALHAQTPTGLQRFVTNKGRLASEYEEIVAAHSGKVEAARNDFLDRAHQLVGVELAQRPTEEAKARAT